MKRNSESSMLNNPHVSIGSPSGSRSHLSLSVGTTGKELESSSRVSWSLEMKMMSTDDWGVKELVESWGHVVLVHTWSKEVRWWIWLWIKSYLIGFGFKIKKMTFLAQLYSARELNMSWVRLGENMDPWIFGFTRWIPLRRNGPCSKCIWWELTRSKWCFV